MGNLRAPVGGFPTLRVHGGQTEAQLQQPEGPLRLSALVASGGWRIYGWSDPVEDMSLSLRELQWLHPRSDGVALVVGARPQIIDARPGEVLIGPPRFSAAMGERFRFLVPVQAWVSCDELSLEGTLNTPGIAERRREALGFDADAPRGWISVGDEPVTLSLEPGGPPFVEIHPDEHPVSVRIVGERGDQRRVLILDWTGAAVVGWIDAAQVHPPSEGGGGTGLLGSLAGARQLTVCTSPAEVDLLTSFEGSPPEPIGALAPGTRFVRGQERGDGLLTITPHPSARVSPATSDVQLLILADALLTCVEETYNPLARVLVQQSEPESVLLITAEVTSLEGLDGVEVGSQCQGRLEHFPESERYPCRLEVRCGDQVLYGHQSTNGYLVDCTIDPEADPPVLSGLDGAPSHSGGGDGAVSIDTAAGTLEVSDVELGHLGAFQLESEIRSIERRDGGEPEDEDEDEENTTNDGEE